MLADLRAREWLPLLATVALFVGIEYATYTTMSRNWADLLGLAYLLVSPAVYTAANSLVAEAPDVSSDVAVSGS